MSRLSGYFTVLATGTAVFLLLPLGLAAQTLSGRVTVLGEQLTEGGAVVTLLDSLSRPVESFEVGRNGGFVISLPGTGANSVAVSLAGYSTLLRDLGIVAPPGTSRRTRSTAARTGRCGGGD